VLRPEQIEFKVLRDSGLTIQQIADRLGIPKRSAEKRWSRILRQTEAARTLESSGYQPTDAIRTPEQAWASHKETFERRVATAARGAGGVIRRDGPFVIAHITDPHVDDDASALSLLEADIAASHSMGAIMCHGGDLLNNWPVAGKLAQQWARQECTMPDALLRAQHYIALLKPDAWTDGNHELFNPYLVNLLDSWLPQATLRGEWRVDFTVEVPGAEDVRVALSHKFQKGSSWFNPGHGGVREMLEGDDFDIYLEGHLHIDGVIERTLPERGTSALIVSSAGYKMLDRYAERISRGGKQPKLRGRVHWIVIDPFAAYHETRAVAFKSPDQAAVYLGGLRSLRGCCG
jgi:hypothetical protein